MSLMYRVPLAVFCFLIGSFAIAQDNKISLEKIWKQGTYQAKGVGGIVSMNDWNSLYEKCRRKPKSIHH